MQQASTVLTTVATALTTPSTIETIVSTLIAVSQSQLRCLTPGFTAIPTIIFFMPNHLHNPLCEYKPLNRAVIHQHMYRVLELVAGLRPLVRKTDAAVEICAFVELLERVEELGAAADALGRGAL